MDSARGEYESAQIGLRSSTPGSTTVTVIDSAGLNVTGFIEGYVYVKVGSAQNTWYHNRGSGPGWYPDPLTPYVWGSSISLTANRNQPVWVNIHAPRDALPGLHTVRLMAGSTPLRIDVNVHNITLPVVPSLDSSMLLWSIRYNKQAEQVLADCRLQAEYVNPPVLPSQGVASAGFWMDVNSTATSVGRAVPTDAEAQAQVKRFPGIRLHSYVLDESPTPTSSVLSKIIATHTVLRRNGILVLETVPPGRGWEGSLDIGVTMAQQPMWSKSSGVIPWFYWTLNQDRDSFKNFIDMLPINLRHLTGYSIASRGYKGVLYWGLDRWGSDPWNKAEGSMGDSYPGEAVLLYKLPNGTIVPCIRLENLRDGAEDFDTWEMAVAAGKEAQARTIVSPVVGIDWNTWTRSATVMNQTHAAMLTLLDGTIVPPPPPVLPTWKVMLQRVDTAATTVQAESAEAAVALALKGSPTWILGTAPTGTATEVK